MIDKRTMTDREMLAKKQDELSNILMGMKDNDVFCLLTAHISLMLKGYDYEERVFSLGQMYHTICRILIEQDMGHEE